MKETRDEQAMALVDADLIIDSMLVVIAWAPDSYRGPGNLSYLPLTMRSASSTIIAHSRFRLIFAG
jgi:hypothetical protein